MVVAGYRAKQRDMCITLLKEYTGGWLTDVFYECMLSKIKAMYRKLGYNEDLQDKYELVCLRFTQYDRSIFDYL